MMMSTPDIMPTVLGLCGLEDRIPQEVQGRNLAPLFFNGNVRWCVRMRRCISRT